MDDKDNVYLPFIKPDDCLEEVVVLSLYKSGIATIVGSKELLSVARAYEKFYRLSEASAEGIDTEVRGEQRMSRCRNG